MAIHFEYSGKPGKALKFLDEDIGKRITEIIYIMGFEKIVLTGTYECKDGTDKRNRELVVLENDDESIVSVPVGQDHMESLEYIFSLMDIKEKGKPVKRKVHYGHDSFSLKVRIGYPKKPNLESLALSNIGISAKNVFDLDYLYLPIIIGAFKSPLLTLMNDEFTLFTDSRHYPAENIDKMPKGIYIVDYGFMSKFS